MLDVKKIRLILELRESGIADSNILSAIEKIPREKFIPHNFRNQAYDNIASVSYTHLRAHETSLHLVCRLLLEKKKTPVHLSRMLIAVARATFAPNP